MAKVLELWLQYQSLQWIFRVDFIDWFDLLAVQGTLKSLLRHHSSKALVLWCSAFYMVHLSHLYMTTWETIDLTRWTFVGKVMSLLFNNLSRFVIAFLPRSKHPLISLFPPSIFYEVIGPDAISFIFWMLISNQLFHSPLSPSSRGSLVPLCFLPYRWCHLHIWDYWYFSWQSWLQLELHPAWHFTWCTLHII